MADDKQQSAAPSNMGKILGIVFAVVNLLVTGGGAFLVYKSTIGWQSPQITEMASREELDANREKFKNIELLYTMDKFTTNLGGEPKRTIQIEINLNMLDTDGFEEIMTSDNRAKTRDAIVQTLNGTSFSQIDSIQGKLFLKDQIIAQVNKILDKGVVKDIYFSDFVVQ